MNTVTTEQAIETYRRTVKDEQRFAWAGWVCVIADALVTGDETIVNGTDYPVFVRDAYKALKAENKISMADELK